MYHIEKHLKLNMFSVCTSVTVLFLGSYYTSCKTFAIMLKESANIAMEFMDMIQIIQSIFSSLRSVIYIMFANLFCGIFWSVYSGCISGALWNSYGV